MTDLTQQLQKAQQEIVILKSRILDTQDAAQQKHAEAQQMGQALQQIASELGLIGENGEVKLDDVVSAVVALIPHDEQTQVEQGE